MKKLSAVFFGTHQFAAHILHGLLDDPFIQITEIVTQPDRPVGRKHLLLPSKVKEIALKHGIPLEQPGSLRNFRPSHGSYDIFIVAQYGLLIPKTVLELPRFGTINVHTSLLPKYRGASPIQTAIKKGEANTGVTIMIMDEGLDTGPILSQKQIEIGADDTYFEVESALADISVPLLIETLRKYTEGSIVATAQDAARATTCSKISKEDGEINWNNSCDQIYNQYRAYAYWPGVWTVMQGKRLKLIRIAPGNITVEAGKITFIDGTLYIGTRDKAIHVIELQPEGKNKMDARAFMNGYAHVKDTVLESAHSV